jgi:hypothetical protein
LGLPQHLQYQPPQPHPASYGISSASRSPSFMDPHIIWYFLQETCEKNNEKSPIDPMWPEGVFAWRENEFRFITLSKHLI